MSKLLFQAKSLRVFFITTGIDYGGAETQLVNLAKRLKMRGWNVRVVSMLRPQAYVDDLEQAGIPVDSLGMLRGKPDPRALFHLASILRRERPQVVHSHMVHANVLARLARLLAQIPVLVCTAHNINEGGHLREWAYRLTDFLCDITTQVSRTGLARYVRIGAVPRDKIHFIPNGVDTDRFSHSPATRVRVRRELGLEGCFAWLAVGRFEIQKDYPTMLQAFARAAQDRKDMVLLVVGQGPQREDLKRLVLELGINGKVRFLGVRKDIPDLINAADGYLMSSIWEGMPIVLLEACAVGLPVVATDVGGNREIIVEGKSGFLVPPKDPEALSRAILRLMELSPEEKQSMGEYGRRYVEENYTLERVVDQWEMLYRKLMMKKLEEKNKHSSKNHNKRENSTR